MLVYCGVSKWSSAHFSFLPAFCFQSPKVCKNPLSLADCLKAALKPIERKPTQYCSRQAKLDDKGMTPDMSCLTQHEVRCWLMTLRTVIRYKKTLHFCLDCRYQDSKDPGEWNNSAKDAAHCGRNLRLSFLYWFNFVNFQWLHNCQDPQGKECSFYTISSTLKEIQWNSNNKNLLCLYIPVGPFISPAT